VSLHYSLPELQSQLAKTLTRERIRGWMCLPLWERIKVLKLISTIQLRKKPMKFNPDDSWLHKTDINPHYEELLKEGDRKMMNKLHEIQTLEARCEFLKKNLRGAVQMYKDEKDRRQFAEKELERLKRSFKDPVNEARKAGL